MKPIKLTLIYLLAILSTTGLAIEGPSMRDMGRYETPSRHASGTITFNLGPTGARGWVHAQGGGPLFWGENGKEILVTHVDAGSPADGVLQPFDTLLGVGGKPFDTDARVLLGQAIFHAETTDGNLRLTRWRDGEVTEVVIALPTLNKEAAVVPLKPEHSTAIRERALAYLTEHMHPDGFKMHPSYRDLNVLFLLSQGRPEDLDAVRRNIQHIINQDPSGEYGPWAWVTGSDAVLLSEYFQITGDTSVLPALANICRWMENSRSYAGGWGHGGPYGGYGHVGLPGMFNAIGLALARECGITGYDRVLKDAANFYARGSGLGMLSYGGEGAGMNLHTIYGDNGKCGTAAVLFSVLDDEVNAQAYSKVAAAMAPYNESGHTGHFWSYSWGGIGSTLAPQPYRRFHAETTAWYYTLARTWRGGFTAQPWRIYMGSYAPGGAIASTGGYALWYCRPMQSLRILGREKSVFAQPLSGLLAKARKKFYDNDYDGCMGILNRLDLSGDDKRWADALAEKVALARETIKLTKAAIEADLRKGDVYQAERRLAALKPILSDPAEVAALEEQLATPESKAKWERGETYSDAMQWGGNGDFELFYRAPQMAFNSEKRKALEEMAADEDGGYYSAQARAALTQWPADPAIEPTDLVKTDMEFAGEPRLFVGPDADAARGVSYKYYEFDEVPEDAEALRQMAPVKEGVVEGIDLSQKKRNTNFGFVFRTFLDVEAEQEVKFTTTSDDGSFLYVDGELVVENGGLHGMISKHGTVQLKQGRRELECAFIQGRGGFGLKVDMRKTGEAPAMGKADKAFVVDDPAAITGLRLKVKASEPVRVSLNGEVICRYAKKRRKEPMLDVSWKEWEAVTLKPIALTLLKDGENVITVETPISPLAFGTQVVGVQLESFATGE